MKKIILLILFVFAGYISEAQRSITLEDIWKNQTFQTKSIPGFNFLKDGKHYTRLIDNSIQKFDLTTGEYAETLFDASDEKLKNFKGRINAYTFSEDENKIVLRTGSEKIYRRSTKANFYVWEKGSSLVAPVFEDGKHSYATLNKKANKVAFVFENNLYMKDLVSNNITQITSDGKKNEVINGSTDWVYEEEFGFAKAFEWSPDGKSIAFLRFDESQVKEFTMTRYNGDAYPEYQTFKYPKVGEDNALVEVFIYNTSTQEIVRADVGKDKEIYYPRIRWTLSNDLVVFRMNRHQNHLELLKVNRDSGMASVLIEEKNKYYIDIHDNLTFLKDGQHFLWTSEMDGYNHIYMYNLEGKLIRQLTNGEYEIGAFYGVDEKGGKIYFSSTEKSPLERHIYTIDLEGKNKKNLTPDQGWHRAQFSKTFDYFVKTKSTINSPNTYTVCNQKGKTVREIVNNKGVKTLQNEFGVQPVDFFDFNTADGTSLNGWMIKPADFDPAIEYPVFMYVYGGPGSQQVTNSWKGSNYWWFQMLAQKGYIVACVDNRGTGGRGQEFKKMTYLKLGEYETVDQIEAARYLGSLPFADASRVGIFGWSYGGYMSSLCILKGFDVFKSAIAVAPVTHWKWYDTVYTERYMRTVDENEEGYEQNAPTNFAHQLTGNYLLVHGNTDDNVHFQQTAEMANALIKANKQYDTYFYPNRAHGIRGDNARLHLYTKMTNFLDQKLKGGVLENDIKP